MRLTRPAVLLLCSFVFLASCVKEQAPPPPPPKPPLEWIGEWGARGDGPGQLSRPVSIAADFAGNIYVADAGNGYIHKFDSSGKPLLSFQDLSLKLPGGIAVDEGGGIYVTDTVGNQLLIFKPDGERFARIRRTGSGLLSNPSGVAVASDGTFYVADLDGTRVTRYDGRLRPMDSWKLPGESPAAKGAFADVAVGHDWNLYATDPRSVTVHRFNTEAATGAPEKDFVVETRNPDGVNTERFGLSVSDRFVFLIAASGRLLIWSLDGNLLLSHALRAAHSTEPDLVYFDVVWSSRGELFVLDQANARVLRFRVNL